MGKLVDLTGKVFGYLTVVALLPKVDGCRRLWLCQCVCGNTTRLTNGALTTGNTKSCGCGCRRSNGDSQGNSLYGTWRSMLNRCYNKNMPSYSDYGGRGISVSDEWRSSYLAFKSDMTPKPSKNHQLERKNNNLGYSKDNCKWATTTEQHRNMRSNFYITHNNKTQCLIDWATEVGIPRTTIRQRIAVLKWSVERALTTPPLKRGGKNGSKFS